MTKAYESRGFRTLFLLNMGLTQERRDSRGYSVFVTIP